jgi:hypothetical protein
VVHLPLEATLICPELSIHFRFQRASAVNWMANLPVGESEKDNHEISGSPDWGLFSKHFVNIVEIPLVY